jgi:hypothetical protein
VPLHLLFRPIKNSVGERHHFHAVSGSQPFPITYIMQIQQFLHFDAGTALGNKMMRLLVAMRSDTQYGCVLYVQSEYCIILC